MIYPDAPLHWSKEEYGQFLDMLKAFGHNCFQFFLPPTLNGPGALKNEDKFVKFVEIIQDVNDLAHEREIQTNYISTPNCIGPQWYAACPQIPDEMQMIKKLWRRWSMALKGCDIVTIFPGDPGGCGRNGCNYDTFVDFSLKLIEILHEENPDITVEIGTWGSPFAGWGDDLLHIENYDGSFRALLEHRKKIGLQTHLFKRTISQAGEAIEYFINKLPNYPLDAMVNINLGFSPDSDALDGGDSREYAREIAKQRRINSWDYSVTEGELSAYPCWKLPRIFSRRREERTAAPYYGAMSYTMSPKLSQLSMYAAAQACIDSDRDPDLVSREFCKRVFGAEHEMLGELFEAFEVVPGWGFHPRRRWSRESVNLAYTKIIEHLEDADTSKCDLPIFPSPEEYKKDILWFAKLFKKLSGPNPDRKEIRKEYFDKALSIFRSIPEPVCLRADDAADRISELFLKEEQFSGL